MSEMEQLQSSLNMRPVNIYRLKMLMLFLYRGVAHKYCFCFDAKPEDANKLEHLVFEYTEGGKKIYRILQAKHTLDGHTKINASSLLTENNGDYSLIKYFFFYQELKKEILCEDGLIKDFTICTNIDLDTKNLESKKIRVKKIAERDDIVDLKSNRREPARYKFSEDIAPLLKSKLQNYYSDKLARTSEYSEDEIKDFLNHLVFVVNQPNEEEVGSIIRKEISKEFDFVTVENVHNKLFMIILNWLQGKERFTFLSYEEGKNLFDEVNRGIHFCFDVNTPVVTFTGRTKILDDLHTILYGKDKHTRSQFACISGLDGVGKTELARKYISEYSQEYDNKIVWINAESYQTLVNSFRRLASDLLIINTKNANNAEIKISSIVKDVYKFFSDTRCLFIFDNAEKYESEDKFDHGIEKFLPSLPFDGKEPNVLIISCNKKWPRSVQVLPLSVFDEAEAVEFIRKSLNLKDDIREKDIKELVNQLQLFPLALQQTVAYLRMQDVKLKNIESELEICDYLKKCKEKTKEFLNFKLSKSNNDNDYTKIIYSTCSITLDAIRQHETGHDTCNIFNVLSYFASENIPTEIMSKLVHGETNLASIIVLLKQYSLVNISNTKLNLHRLIQQVMRLRVQGQYTEEEVLLKASKLFEKNNLNSENVNHAITLWNYLCKYNNLVNKFAPVTEEIFNVLLGTGNNLSEKRIIAVTLSEGGKCTDALKLYREILMTEERLLGKTHLQTLTTKHNIGATLGNQGRYQESLKILQEIYNIQETIFEENHPNTLKLKCNIAVSLSKQGKHKEAFKTYQELCSTQKDVLGDDHEDTLISQYNMAESLRTLGKYDESFEVMNEVFHKQKRILGYGHPYTLTTQYGIAFTLQTQKKYGEALELYEKILNISNNSLGLDHQLNLKVMNSIAALSLELGDIDGSIQYYQKILKFQKKNLDEDNLDSLLIKSNIGMALHCKEQYEEALFIYQDVFDKLQKLQPNHPQSLNIRNKMASALYGQKKFDKALQIFKEILYEQEIILGKEHDDTTATKGNIAGILIELGKHHEAQKVLREGSKGFFTEDRDSIKISNTKKSLSSAVNDLLITVKSSDFEKLERLISNGGDINTKDDDNRTLLHWAVNNTNVNMVKTLLKGGADATQVSNKGNTPLHIASSKGHNKIIELLLESVSPDKLRDFVNAKTTASGATALHVAAKNGSLDVTKFMLKYAAAYDIQNNNGETPFDLSKDNNVSSVLKLVKELFEDAKRGNVEIIKKLKEIKSDELEAMLNARDSQGYTLLVVAQVNKHTDISRGLLEIMKTSYKFKKH